MSEIETQELGLVARLLETWPHLPAEERLQTFRSLAADDSEDFFLALGPREHAALYHDFNRAERRLWLRFLAPDDGADLIQELPEELRTKFNKRYGEKDRLEIIENAYQKPFPNRYFGSFSKFIFDNRQHPFLYQLVSDAFSIFFDKYILKYPDYQKYKIHFTGSVAFYYSDILRRVATEKGCTVGVIMETPIAGLTLFHRGF